MSQSIKEKISSLYISDENGNPIAYLASDNYPKHHSINLRMLLFEFDSSKDYYLNITIKDQDNNELVNDTNKFNLDSVSSALFTLKTPAFSIEKPNKIYTVTLNISLEEEKEKVISTNETYFKTRVNDD